MKPFWEEETSSSIKDLEPRPTLWLDFIFEALFVGLCIGLAGGCTAILLIFLFGAFIRAQA